MMKKISEEILCKGQWLSLKKSLFTNSGNQKVSWESVERSNNTPSFGIIAKLIPSNRYILIKQFRQAINNYVLGLPAGVCGLDVACEKDLNHCILKELKEETGYTGSIKSKSPVLKLNPAIMDHDFSVVTVEVDETDPRNKNVQQQLEPAEEIQTILIKQGKIKDFLLEQNNKGVAISSGLWFLAHSLN
jgi:ADP-ribose pyrophosphatase